MTSAKGRRSGLENNYTFVMEDLPAKSVYTCMQEMMSADAKHAVVALSPGQLWKTDSGCILITDHGKRLVAYKKLRDPNQRTAVTNLIRPEALVSYLQQVGAELANSAPC